MIRIVVPVRVKKEFLKKYSELVQLLIDKSRDEEGCIEYSLVKTDREDFFYFVELWKDEKSFQEHLKTAHFQEYFPVLGEMVKESFPPEIYNSVTPIFRRGSVRDFQEKKVEDFKIEKILKAGMAAPTAGNQQPWEFIVIKNREVLNLLSEVSPYATSIKKTQIAIAVIGSPNGMKYPQNIEQDLSATTENILLQCVEEGIGGVWVGISPEVDRMEKMRTILNLTEEKIPFSLIPLGYPKEEIKVKDKFNLEKISCIN